MSMAVNVSKIVNDVQEVLEGVVLTDGKVSVDINENQLNILITFTYNKLLGRITIKYVDAVTGEEIAEPDVMENLEFGTYEVQPKYIQGYELSK